MTHSLHDIQSRLGATFLRFGQSDDRAGVDLVESFGHYPAEYAAIRRYVAIMHLPQRAVLRCTGEDRKDFLHRMLTQNINDLAGGSTVWAFQLNEKGRIIADVVVHHGDADTWLEMDRVDLPAIEALYEDRLFAEDVTLEDWSDQRAGFALHGPAATALLNAVMDQSQADWESPHRERLADMPGTHHVVSLAGSPVTVYRMDDAGVPGFHLHVPMEAAATLYEALLDKAGYDAAAEEDPDADYAQQRREGLRGRPIGWLAYNTARIEAGTPLYHVDFGSDSLPGETGLLDEAVSFNKGCYAGQEIVARMKNLGHPKRMIVGLKMDSDALPIAGAQVFPAADSDKSEQVIGGITSSTLSPLLGNTAIAFAVVKWGQHQPGTMLRVSAEGQLVAATVREKLRFLD